MDSINIRKGQVFNGLFTPDPSTNDLSFDIVNEELGQKVEVWLPNCRTCMAADEITDNSHNPVPGELVQIQCVDYTEPAFVREEDAQSSGCRFHIHQLPHANSKDTR